MSRLVDAGPPDLVQDMPRPLCDHPWVGMRCQAHACEIPAGCFLMGSPTAEWCRRPEESWHVVTLTHGFEVARFEVTQGQFATLMGYNPSSFSSCGTDCPVEKVSWHEAAQYCNRLTAAHNNDTTKTSKISVCYVCSGQKDSLTCRLADPWAKAGSSVYRCSGYRLPTEAEWEYAARAGATTSLFAGQVKNCAWDDGILDRVGWYNMNAFNRPRKAAQKLPNDWGLFDTAGNVREWVYDWSALDLGNLGVTDPVGPQAGMLRVIRGGSWQSKAGQCRSASRERLKPESRENTVGFRWVRTLTP